MTALPRILVIDDDYFWSETLAEFLRRRGFMVIEARDAAEGLGLLNKIEVSLIISDYRLPGMDGLHLLRLLQKQGRGVSVVMVSSEDELSLPKRALAAGAIAYLEKATSPVQFIRKIRQILSRILVKELTAPTLKLWQRLLPNPHRSGHTPGRREGV